jgi:hypothetical protein
MDKYDEQIAYLTEHPKEIGDHWMYPSLNGPLFKVLKTGISDWDADPWLSPGCLTTIRAIGRKAAFVKGNVNMKLTEEIRNDERIAKDPINITIESLPIFAYYQRKFDALNS